MRKTTTHSLLDRFVWCPKRKQTGSHRETFWYVHVHVLGSWSNLQQPTRMRDGCSLLTSNPSLIIDHRSLIVGIWQIVDTYSQHGSMLAYFLPQPATTTFWNFWFDVIFPSLQLLCWWVLSQGLAVFIPRRDTFVLELTTRYLDEWAAPGKLKNKTWLWDARLNKGKWHKNKHYYFSSWKASRTYSCFDPWSSTGWASQSHGKIDVQMPATRCAGKTTWHNRHLQTKRNRKPTKANNGRVTMMRVASSRRQRATRWHLGHMSYR